MSDASRCSMLFLSIRVCEFLHMPGDQSTTEIPRNQLIPCSTREAIGIACRAACVVHVAASLLLCVIAEMLLGSRCWSVDGAILTVAILMVQLATFGIAMIPAAVMSAIFAQLWFRESLVAIERVVWILILTVEANIIGWIILPWFCLTP